jgi:hypothetical protein
MKFRFTYDGPLHAGTNSGPRPDDQWRIRRQVHPQLAELWRTHPALTGLGLSVYVSSGAGVNWGGPKPIDIKPSPTVRSRLTEVIERNEYGFVPLVRKSLELTCELKIIFLRRGEPGSLIVPGGDLDNRIKTFFDGLKVPDAIVGNQQIAGASPDPNPLLCLVEQDALITGFSIETDRLLTPDHNNYQDNVRLVVEATIRVMRITPDNVGFLGD